MKRILKITLLGFVLCFTLTVPSYAVGYNFKTEQPMTVEEAYEKMGFTTINNAIKEFRDKYNFNITLPQEVPFNVEYKYGKVEGKYSRVVLEYLGENFSGNHLVIFISTKIRDRDPNFVLKDGTQVHLQESNNPNHPTALFFQKNNLEYFLSLSYKDKGLEKEKIIEIAESFQEF